MGRRNFNDGQEVKLEDLNAITYAVERQVFERLLPYFTSHTDDAFFEGSFLVSRVDSNTVSVAAGLGFQRDNTKFSPNTKLMPLYLGTATNVDITAPHATLNRYDIVCVKAAVADELTETRKFKDEETQAISDENMVVQQDWEAEILVVAGTASGSPSAPATPSGYIKIATILVTAVTGIAASGDVTDNRTTMPKPANDVLTTKGDLLTRTASALARLGVGTNGSLLTPDSSQSTGLKWTDATFPSTATLGDVLYASAANVFSKLSGNTSTTKKYLQQTGTGSAAAAPVWAALPTPTIQKFTSGSGTYTTPAGVAWIRVRMVGGGGGGAGSGTSLGGGAYAGVAGGNTTFGTCTANGGSPGQTASFGAGGSATLGSGFVGLVLSGQAGGYGPYSTSTANTVYGGDGGSSVFGGAGKSSNNSTAVGIAAVANTGSGGSGGGLVATVNTYSGGGGGAGGYIDAIIVSPASSYSYSVGSGGVAGSAGPNGAAGGAGAAGQIIVEEYYQ